MGEMSKRATIEVDGIPQANIENCDIEVNSNDQEVITLLGLVGYSDGATIYKITGKSCVPEINKDANYFALCKSHTTVTFTFRMGGESHKVKGRFMTVKKSTDAKNPNACDFTFGGFDPDSTA